MQIMSIYLCIYLFLIVMPFRNFEQNLVLSKGIQESDKSKAMSMFFLFLIKSVFVEIALTECLSLIFYALS